MEIEVPEALKVNISTGWSEIDQLFSGDGIMPSTVCLVTGVPSSGKSTMLIQLADQITGVGLNNLSDKTKGGVVLYNGLEESFYQVKRVIDRVGLKNGFIPSYESEVNDLIEIVF
jgi:predicted ATP-dependent serine protease